MESCTDLQKSEPGFWLLKVVFICYAELEDGSWRIIEAGDGEVSGLSEFQDYEQYFRALYQF